MHKKFSKNFLLAFVAIALSWAHATYGSVSGTISGFVRDRESNMPLPNASVIIEGTFIGASADKAGFYVINNVPLGIYVLKAQMIGYGTTKVTDVVIKTGQNTLVDFHLTSQVLQIEPEIIITAPRTNLPPEALNSAHHVEERDIINNMPIGTFQDALSLLPGISANHFRGGRRSEVLYVIDGLPVTGAMTRELSFMVPNTSIAEMVVQTGGFSAEYGNALSGIVNVVTKDGRNDFQGIAKITTNAIGFETFSYDHHREAEFAIGGPFAGSFGGPVVDGNYFLSANIQASDTPYLRQLDDFFPSPVRYNYNLNAKLVLRLSDKMQLRLQSLGSRWNWREYDPQWENRLSALPERDNRSLRLSATLIHTLSSKMFYSLSASITSLQHNVHGEAAADSSGSIELPSRSPAETWPGAVEPWRERLLEQAAHLRLNFVRQIHPAHQFSTGIETQIYDIAFTRDRYLMWPLPIEASKPDNFIYTRYQDDIRRYPFTLAAFVQNKIKTSYLSANLGMRYEVYRLTNGVASSPLTTRNYKRVLSPRLSLAFPLTDRSQVSLNYGWFYQMPPLFYAYTNVDGNLDSYWPIIGSTSINPARSVAYEAAYRWSLTPDILLSATGFWRHTTDLVDVVSAPLPDSDEGRGYARYANVASAQSKGFELLLQKSYSQDFSGFIHYSYLRARGTASSAEASLQELFRGVYNSRQVEMPLEWDQNHTILLNLNYARQKLNVNFLHRFDGPLEAYSSPFVSRPALPWRYHLDVKVSHAFKSSLGRIEPFIEARNLFDKRYPTVQDDGLAFNHANSPWQDRFGRSFRVGVVIQ